MKYFYIITNNLIQINAVLLNVLFIKEQKYILVLTKILSGITVFNINNYEGSFDTEDWSNSYWKNNFTAGIHYIVKYIKIEDSYFKL